MTPKSIRRAGAAAAMLAVLLARAAAPAASGGIASTVFGAVGCPQCHFGGTVPAVVLSGPSVATPGNTYELTLTVFGDAIQTHAGLNVSASDGVLGLGGPFAADTRTILGAGGRTEITHQTPKLGDPLLHAVEFSFEWTAPPAFTSVTISGWGNAVNRNFGTSGDNAGFDAIVVVSDALGPTPTPTPGPQPCADAAAPDPALLGDAALRRCQAAIAKAGTLYLKQHLAAAQACLKAVQLGKLAGDPATLCLGSAVLAPSDTTLGGKLAKAESKARAVLSAKCGDGEVAALDLCADTAAEFADCFVSAHRQRALAALAAQYGAAAVPADTATAKCQAAAAKAAAKLLIAHLRAGQKCLAAREKSGAPLSGAGALCIGSLAGGALQPPQQTKAADKIGQALAKLADRIDAACTDAQIAALDVCGATRADYLSCLTCAQAATLLDIVADEYGGN